MLDLNQQRAHLLLREVYEKLSRHNNRSQLDGVVADESIWQRPWRHLSVQLAIWYATPSGAVGSRFTTILGAEL